MAKPNSFGMKVEPCASDINSPDFRVDKNSGSELHHNNPYGKAWFDSPDNMAIMQKSPARITSIPSPYARMHITDIAFKEMTTGGGVISAEDMQSKSISLDYLHAMSHCLDFYELFFYYKELDLREKGISITRIKLVDIHDPAAASLFAQNNALKSYVETLCLFRNEYLKVIGNRAPQNYYFNFDTLYLFKDIRTNTVLGATSPFTGFFAKSTCNVVKKGDDKSPRLTVNIPGYRHNLLTSTQSDWKSIQERPYEFQKFMYMLLEYTGLKLVFVNLYEAVKNAIVMTRDNMELAKLDSLDFTTEYPEFNFGDEKLPKINSNKEAYLRISDIDKSSLKYILYLYTKEPFNMSISNDLLDVKIAERVFPDNSLNLVPWLCVNDFLSEALFVLPYEINDNYVAVEYTDIEKGTSHRRCLLPIKKRVLEYFPNKTLEEIAKDVSVVKYPDGHYAVTYKVTLEQKDSEGNAVQVDLRREYYKNDYTLPNGIVYESKDLDGFAFGIYPFVKSSHYTNIYKVLFYNKFGLEIDTRNQECSLDFFYFNENKNLHEKTPIAFTSNKVKMNYTQKYSSDQKDSINSIYYSIEDSNEANKVKCIEFAELSIAIKDSLGNKLCLGTSLIVPKLKEVQSLAPGQKTYISVDLGTSNSYVAYQYEGEKVIREINTVNSGRSELQFMNKAITTDDYNGVKDTYCHDLYLSPSILPTQHENEDLEEFTKRLHKAWTMCLPTQLNEFIPSHIVPQKKYQSSLPVERQGEGFSFPIPTVINCLREKGLVQGRNNEDVDVDRILDNCLPLLHSSIPFAYYNIGVRSNKQDNISDQGFKWFINTNGVDPQKQKLFVLFASELLFILRSNMLCEGRDLENCVLLWTYPLSFTPRQTDSTAEIWKKGYIKYFNPKLDYDSYELDELVLRTNESLSPFYDSVQSINKNAYTILMDIGGGSTDVIGYDDQMPQFITSFGFAGNSLYMNGSYNVGNGSADENIFTYYIEDPSSCKAMKASSNREFGDATIPIKKPTSGENGLASIMNYGFQKYPKDLNFIFDKEDIQFLLQFYAGSIIYHTAQLSYWHSKNKKEKTGEEIEAPLAIHLSGNGSKLFNLLPDKETLFRYMFKAVYGKEVSLDEMTINSNPNPKAATACGAIKGLNAIKFNSDPKERVILLGDKDRIEKPIKGRNALEIDLSEDKGKLRQNIRKNVENYIDVFYNYLGTNYPYINKDIILKKINQIETDTRFFSIENKISDSYFFRYIARIMEALSVEMLKKLN